MLLSHPFAVALGVLAHVAIEGFSLGGRTLLVPSNLNGS